MKKYLLSLSPLLLGGCTPFYGMNWNPFDFSTLAQYANLAQLIIGAILGAGIIIALILIYKFLRDHWKGILIGCAALTAISLFLLAIK